jgi:hypothetical protein
MTNAPVDSGSERMPRLCFPFQMPRSYLSSYYLREFAWQVPNVQGRKSAAGRWSMEPAQRNSPLSHKSIPRLHRDDRGYCDY